MKVTFVSKAVCAVALMFSLSSFAADKKEKHEKASAPNKVAFNAAVFKIAHSNKINLAVDKYSDSRLKVVLRDKSGNTTYYSETYEADQKYRRIFNLEEMKDGTYYFELTAGDQKLVKEVEISTNSARVISIE